MDTPFFNNRNVPWQRVINSKGGISPRSASSSKRLTGLTSDRGPGGAQRQAVALRREGITVSTGALGELSVDFNSYGWFPSRLPSEEEGDESEEEEEQDEAR